MAADVLISNPFGILGEPVPVVVEHPPNATPLAGRKGKRYRQDLPGSLRTADHFVSRIAGDTEWAKSRIAATAQSIKVTKLADLVGVLNHYLWR